MSVYSWEKVSGGVKGVHLHVDLVGDAQRAMDFLKTYPNALATGGVVRALNRAMAGARTDVVKQARARYNVKAGEVRRLMMVREARGNYKTASLHISGHATPLYAYGARPAAPRPKKPPRIGASVMVTRVSGRLKIPGAFVADMPTRGRSLYYRPGKDRNKVLKLYGVSVPQMVDDDRSMDVIEKGARDRFNKTLNHEIERYLTKRGIK
jgi:hypothetical protein